MSNASATTVTVNTALFTAGDTLTITNIGAGVSTITAGTATVSTGGSLALNQYDSGTLYFTSTGVSIWNGANPGDITGVTAGTGILVASPTGPVPTVSIDTAVTADLTTAQTMTNKTLTTPKISNYTTNGDLVYGTGSSVITRLGIGSSAQVLTVTGGVPVWATPSAGTSGFNLISTTAFTTSSAVNINSVFSATYTAYRIVADYNSSTASDALLMRLRVGGTDNSTAGNYKWAGYYSTATASGGGNQNSGASATTFSAGSVQSSIRGQAIIDIVNPFTAFQTTYYGSGNGEDIAKWFGGNMTVTTSYTGFTLIPGAGTITGSVSVYGYGI